MSGTCSQVKIRTILQLLVPADSLQRDTYKMSADLLGKLTSKNQSSFDFRRSILHKLTIKPFQPVFKRALAPTTPQLYRKDVINVQWCCTFIAMKSNVIAIVYECVKLFQRVPHFCIDSCILPHILRHIWLPNVHPDCSNVPESLGHNAYRPAFIVQTIKITRHHNMQMQRQ